MVELSKVTCYCLNFSICFVRISSMMSVDVLVACAVLQDHADQLSVLGNIIRPGAETERTELHLKTAQQMAGSSLSDFTRELHKSQKQISIQESLLTPDNLAKVQRDRQFMSDVINELMVELQKKNTFQSLLSAVGEDRKKKVQLLDIINREEEGRLRIKALQKQLLDIHKQKIEECKKLKELLDYLREQVQNMRVRTNRQEKFVKRCAEQLVCQGLKLNSHKEKELEDEVGMLQERTEEEKNVHMEMEIFLKRQHANLGEKFQFWIQRYEKDMEEKEQEITALKNKRNNCQARIQELSKKCRNMQEVIIEDRMEKERLRAQLEKEQKERDAATKIQAWWRGTLVRRGLGSPKKATKSKSKGGKKGKKKKK
ncbi:dynein regulatory complex protein 9 isoform X2 [Rhinichthys klamathensis goyatoka]|uniref:dynein regulatory complex protein 9 isoform X2 n=1 Tax=Rhinichthys klamathensis goyatoka TaxID=3034132 RepID=UPI0024B59451|nr:dynein regulatory complex protein 9 isoform X2 [Rhinichthys klamathensis goyatoka]